MLSMAKSYVGIKMTFWEHNIFPENPSWPKTDTHMCYIYNTKIRDISQNLCLITYAHNDVIIKLYLINTARKCGTCDEQ